MPGDCHYLEGNANAKRRVARIKQLLTEIGLEPERVKMVNVSSAMASQFTSEATHMSEAISHLGPNRLRVELKDESTDGPTNEKAEAES